MLPLLLLALGAVLVVAGTAVLSWPVALIVAGVLIAASGLLFLDFDNVTKGGD